MAVDIKKLFNEDLPAALAKNADDAKTIGAKYQMNITGEGAWFIDVSATGPSCKPGEEPPTARSRLPPRTSKSWSRTRRPTECRCSSPASSRSRATRCSR